MAPNFPELIERKVVHPSYAYELMHGCTGGDFCHGLIHPELMGPFRPGPRGWPDLPLPREVLYLCGAGCHGGPGITSILRVQLRPRRAGHRTAGGPGRRELKRVGASDPAVGRPARASADHLTRQRL